MLLLALLPAVLAAPIEISWHWHYHQPIYWPYESVVETENRGAYSFSVAQVHNDRCGPYTSWPITAVASAQDRGFEHIGAQASLSGSLQENLDALESSGWGFGGWKSRWQDSTGWTTSLGNPRLDLVSFGYFHPLMALLDREALALQVELHAEALRRRFGVEPSPGMFPPECAFSPHMIPGLTAAGVEWILVDSIHLERTHVDYPYSSGSNLVPPNGADVLSDAETDWVNLQNIWAPSAVAAPWAYRPHASVYVDPETGKATTLTVVPAARYEGNEDARGGYGALVYDAVLSSYLAQNTDPDHPMLVVLAHDGDNYGAGVESYYTSNWDQMLDWLASRPDSFEGTTIRDYLERFPPHPDDTIHVEDGAWSGADNGDAEFAKWNGDPGADGYSPDRNSWAVVTAATNHVLTAEALSPHTAVSGILDGNGSDTDLAWRWLLVGQTSCYWYWDGAEDGIWDSHPTRAANEAVTFAERAITSAGGSDTVGPTIYPPQREPYNPGGYEWSDTPERTDFDVWTYVYDRAGIASVRLLYRIDGDGCRDVTNEVYDSGGWYEKDMEATAPAPQTDPSPTVAADLYLATVDAGTGVLVDYYVAAVDTQGNETRSDIRHVVVGSAGSASSAWEPANPTKEDDITVFSDLGGWLHWGVNGWQTPIDAYQPAGTTAWSDGIAVETPLDGPDDDGRYSVVIGPFNDPEQAVTEVDFVFRYGDGTWSEDQVIPIGSRAPLVAPDLPIDCVPYYQGGDWDGSNDDWLDDTGDDAGDPSPDDVSTDDGGCGCVTGRVGPGLAGLAGVLLLVRRRR